ncbi:hypothetical protein Q4Q35_16585 [Flavivirga aquimarina]|uniref:Uncharacterized protein n=1 Tax=Flavivirga aquimarina TaxID=2027862 RepID=A0ABT8WE40_9FLAO|nr:hypothetical protein [Flavivirga aquimarina]MDO5971425.1 hypothetical protein [Flavivirga aquimarina]
MQLTIKRWGRSLLYIFIFGSFIASLQLYYVHRKSGGWNGLRGTECVHEYQSFFLIKNRQHFKYLDECLVQLKRQKDNSYQPKVYNYNYIEDYKGHLIDYDIITPKLVWGIIIFIIISIIEMLRRYGPVKIYKAGNRYLKFWQDGFSSYNKSQMELVLLGASVYLIILYALPKINGLPNSTLEIFVLLGILMLAFRIVIRSAGKNLFANKSFKEWFFIFLGILIACALLLISGNRIFYILLVLSIVAYIYTSKLLDFKFFKATAVILLLFNFDNLFALDDGTWSEGGLENMLNDTHGTDGTGQTVENGREAGLITDTALEDDEDSVFIDPTDGDNTTEGQENDTETGEEENNDELDWDEEDNTNEEENEDMGENDNENGDDDDRPIIDRPLGEEY